MKSNRIQQIIENFAGKRVLVIGDAVIDHYVHGVVERLNPEAPVPILRAQEEYVHTGGAGNVAKNLAGLGAKATLVTVTGDDENADQFSEAASEEGYDVIGVRDPERPTIRKVRHIVGSQQLLRVDYERTEDISGDIEAQMIRSIEQAVADGVDGILVSDYAKGAITKEVARKIMFLATANKVPVAVDMKPSRASYFIGATFISPNRKEAHEILGLNEFEQGGRPAGELAQKLREKMECDVYVTLGSEGMYICSLDKEEKHIPQEHVAEVFDVSGAGDTAVSVLLLARLGGASHEEAVRIANAAGAVVVGKIGSVGVSKDELLGMVSHKHE